MIRDKNFYKLLLAVAIPTALQGFISLGVNMLDNIMVGALGDVVLAAVALANQVTVLLTYFIRGISGGSAVLISQYWGRGDIRRIKQVISVSFQFAFYLTVLLSLCIYFFPDFVMRLFTSDPEVIQQGIYYLRILCFSYMLSCISEIMIAMLRCVEVVRIGLVTPFISLFTNLILNYALIFGHWGLPRMEIRGAALATVLSRAIEFVIVFYYVFKIDRRLKMRVRELWSANTQIFRDFVRYGLPIVFGDVQWGLSGVVKNALLGHMGVLMVAANSIADTTFSLFYVFVTGLSSGACVLIGKLVGAGDYKKTRESANTIQLLFLGLGLILCTLLFSVRHIVPQFYQVTPEARALATQFIGIIAIISIGTCYHAACFTGINRGAGDGKFVMKVDMICGWLITLPITYLAGFVLHAPLWVVYICVRIDQCFKWVIALIRLRGDRWIHNVTRV